MRLHKVKETIGLMICLLGFHTEGDGSNNIVRKLVSGHEIIYPRCVRCGIDLWQR